MSERATDRGHQLAVRFEATVRRLAPLYGAPLYGATGDPGTLAEEELELIGAALDEMFPDKPVRPSPPQAAGGLEAAQDAVRVLVDFCRMGDPDDDDEGLDETPRRVTSALLELTQGYGDSPAEILSKRFRGHYDELVLLRDVEFVSLCEHHLMPFQGIAHVGYIADGSGVVGISKLARLVQCFAKRLQVQERMTTQIAEALQEYLSPKGVGVVVKASHACMACRGVRQQRSALVTSAMLGGLRENVEARAEFLALCDMR